LKFFSKIGNSTLIKKKALVKNQKINNKKYLEFTKSNNIKSFSKFIIQNGCSVKEQSSLKTIFKNFNYLFYYNYDYLYNNYPQIKWVIVNLLVKKLNSTHIFDSIIELIKPPFIVTSITVPKKLKKKLKKKYLTKIVYKNEQKRIRNAYKQLQYYSKKFTDSKFKVRLYKSFMFSFLDWKNSHLYKLKSSIFKKFFKF